jgi:hypothetical protein
VAELQETPETPANTTNVEPVNFKAESIDFKPKELAEIERKIALGELDKLPDGRTISEVQEANEAIEKAQRAEREKKVDPVSEKKVEAKAKLTIAENGVMNTEVNRQK